MFLLKMTLVALFCVFFVLWDEIQLGIESADC